MLDICLFREDQGGNPDLIRESQKRRYAKVELVDEVIALDTKWRQCRSNLDLLKKAYNTTKKEIGEFKKKKLDASKELMDKKLAHEADIKKAEQEEEETIKQRDNKIGMIGNLVPDGVPISDDEDNNEVVKTWGEFKADDNMLSHVDLYLMAGIANTEQGSVVAGNRAYYLTGPGALLNNALVSYGLHFLKEREYVPMQTPFFMKKDMMGKVAQLEQFDEELYKVTGEGDDKYLIATSEQTICGYHANDWLDPKNLPIKYAGFSTCFRKEVGSHGRDTLGIFRVHQFEKIEQFVVCSPEGNISWDMQEEMIKNSEEFYQSLGLPYRVVNIVSGELNNAAAKKYDLEAWFPGSKTHRELVSCSNCTDYQTRRLETRYGLKKKDDNKKVYAHMLNSTLTATERTICCILENYQTETGINVPPVLVPYMGGQTFIPFVTPPPKTKGKKLTQRIPTAEDDARAAAGKDSLTDYLKSQRVQEVLNNVLNQVAEQRPENALVFIAEQLAKQGNGSALAPAAAAADGEEKAKTKLGGGGIVIAADEVADDGGDGNLDDFLDAFS